jgi:hypothetical protein
MRLYRAAIAFIKVRLFKGKRIAALTIGAFVLRKDIVKVLAPSDLLVLSSLF